MIFRGQTSADPLVQGPRQTPDLQVTNIFTQNIWHQGSTNFGILPSQMGEHGVTLENMENIENIYKHEADYQKPIQLLEYQMVWREGQILTKAWRPPSQSRHWSLQCLGDTNTCGHRFAKNNLFMLQSALFMTQNSLFVN